MRSTIRDFVVGMTAILGLVGLAVLLWLIGDLPFVKTASYMIRLQMDNAAGVLPSAPITLNGVRVGIVKTVLNNPDDPHNGVELGLAIEKSVRVPKDVSVSVLRDFVGASTLALTTNPESKAGDTNFFAPGEVFKTQASVPGLTGDLSKLLDKRLATLDTAVEKFNTLADEYTTVGKRMNELLAPRTAEEVAAGKPANLVSAIDRFDKAVADARTWLGDDALKGDARTAIHGFSSTLEKTTSLIEAWKGTAEKLNSTADKAGDSFNKAMDSFSQATRELSTTLHTVQEIAGKVNQGEGTAGQLLNNPDLYRNLTDAAAKLEAALNEAQLLIQKYRAEGIPIRF